MPLKPHREALAILLVEDDEGDAWAVERAFLKTGFAKSIVRANDGLEALDILKGTNGKTRLARPCLLLVDMNMPRMNGIEFVRALREDKELCRLIVFMLSTSKHQADETAAYDLNVAGYITKAKLSEDFTKLVDLVGIYSSIVEIV